MTDRDDQRDTNRGPHRCPTCRRVARSVLGDGIYPFCSDRCRLVDLNRWLDGAYQLPADDDDPDEADPPARD